jgi:hypothetical protein
MFENACPHHPHPLTLNWTRLISEINTLTVDVCSEVEDISFVQVKVRG